MVRIAARSPILVGHDVVVVTVAAHEHVMHVVVEFVEPPRINAEERRPSGALRRREVGSEKAAAFVVPELARVPRIGRSPLEIRVADRARLVGVGIAYVARAFGVGRRGKALA